MTIRIAPHLAGWRIRCSCGWTDFASWWSDVEELASEHERLAECDW